MARPSPVISVIIPVYNVEKYLAKCIHSVQNNTYKHLEIICINDGSTDNCLDILRYFASRDTRMIIIDQNNEGLSAARNAGLARATGEYVSFIDSDDFIHPLYFETLLNCIVKKKADIVSCECRKFDEFEEPELLNYRKISYRRLNDLQFSNNYYARHIVCAKLYRKKDIENFSFSIQVKFSEDTLFNLLVVSSLSSPIVYQTDTILYFYRMRSSSIIHTEKAERRNDIGNWYLRNRVPAVLSYTGSWKWILLMHIVKTALSYRHTVWYVQRDKKQINHANRLLKISLKDLKETHQIPIIDYLILKTMTSSPWLYRLFRIIQDPSMLRWEKMESENTARNLVIMDT